MMMFPRLLSHGLNDNRDIVIVAIIMCDFHAITATDAVDVAMMMYGQQVSKTAGGII
jgi:hypothetical protein